MNSQCMNHYNNGALVKLESISRRKEKGIAITSISCIFLDFEKKYLFGWSEGGGMDELYIVISDFKDFFINL